MYKSLGIEIYKPNLRAALERDLIKVSNGEIKIDEIYSDIKSESLLLFQDIYNNMENLQNNLANYLQKDAENDKDSFFEMETLDTEDTNDNTEENSVKKSLIHKGEKTDIDKDLEILEEEKKQLEELKKELESDISKEKKAEIQKKIAENILRKQLGLKAKDENENDNGNSGKKIMTNNKILEINKLCPDCKNSNLKISQNRYDGNYFVNCPTFPKCRYSKNIKNPKKIIITDELCETCEESGLRNPLWEIHFIRKNKEDIIQEKCLVCVINEKDKIIID